MNETVVNMSFAIFMALVLFSVVVAARFVFGLVCRMEGYSLNDEIASKDNPAIGARFAFFLIAVVLSFSNIIHPSGISFYEDLSLIGKYSTVVIAMLLVSRYVNDYLILSGFDNNKEVVGEKNVAVALVEGATYVGTAFIISGALAGWQGGYLVSFCWFILGQAFFILLAWVYRRFVPDTFNALDTHNHACALSLGGLLLSGGYALGKAVSGQFHSWSSDLPDVGLYILGWMIFMFIAALVADKVMLPTTKLRDEVMRQRNIAAGAIEGAAFISTTLLYTLVV